MSLRTWPSKLFLDVQWHVRILCRICVVMSLNLRLETKSVRAKAVEYCWTVWVVPPRETEMCSRMVASRLLSVLGGGFSAEDLMIFLVMLIWI